MENAPPLILNNSSFLEMTPKGFPRHLVANHRLSNVQEDQLKYLPESKIFTLIENLSIRDSFPIFTL